MRCTVPAYADFTGDFEDAIAGPQMLPDALFKLLADAGRPTERLTSVHGPFQPGMDALADHAAFDHRWRRRTGCVAISTPDHRQRGQDADSNAYDGEPIVSVRLWQQRQQVYVIVGRRREAALLIPIEAGARHSDACAAVTRTYSQPQTATTKAIADATP
jgi:hypothetical protein